MAGKLISQKRLLDEVIALASAWNAKNNPPLEYEKVEATCTSIWKTHQRKHPDEITVGTDDAELTLFDIDEARVSSFLNTEPPPRRWLLQDCLPFQKVGAIVAPGGTGKSQFLLQLAVSVAAGIPFMDHWNVPESGGVLMLAAEDDTDEIHRRLHNICVQLIATHRDDYSLSMRIKENLYIRSMVAQDNLMTCVTIGDKEVRMTSYVPRLVRTAAEIPNLKLVIVDPASRFRGGDENFAQDTTRFIEALEQVREKTGATVLVAHHTNKWSGNAEEQSQGAARGSSAFSDGVRWQMNLKSLNAKAARDRGIPDELRKSYVEAEIVKNNYGPPTGSLLLKRGDGGFLGKITMEPSGSSHKDAALLAAIKARLKTEAKAGALLSPTRFVELIGGQHRALKVGKVTLRKKLKEFVASGELKVVNGKLNPDTPMPSDSKPSSDKKIKKTET